jgi:hypothetical protein
MLHRHGDGYHGSKMKERVYAICEFFEDSAVPHISLDERKAFPLKV